MGVCVCVCVPGMAKVPLLPLLAPRIPAGLVGRIAGVVHLHHHHHPGV